MPTKLDQALLHRLFVNGLDDNNTVVVTSSTPSFAVQWNGSYVEVPAGGVVIDGLRLVRNYVTSSDNLDPVSSDWSATNSATASFGSGYTTINFAANENSEIALAVQDTDLGQWKPGRSYVISAAVRCASGTEKFRLKNWNATAGAVTATPNLTATTEWQRFAMAFTADAVNNGNVSIINATDAAARSIQVRDYQFEDTTANADTTLPSEYVSVGVEPSPYHGAGVDGIKYFSTENSNTVVNYGVITPGVGTPLTGISLLMESAAGETLSYSGVPSGNDEETRAIVDGFSVDLDNWDGVVDDSILPTGNGRISEIRVYRNGERPIEAGPWTLTWAEFDVLTWAEFDNLDWS